MCFGKKTSTFFLGNPDVPNLRVLANKYDLPNVCNVRPKLCSCWTPMHTERPKKRHVSGKAQDICLVNETELLMSFESLPTRIRATTQQLKHRRAWTGPATTKWSKTSSAWKRPCNGHARDKSSGQGHFRAFWLAAPVDDPEDFSRGGRPALLVRACCFFGNAVRTSSTVTNPCNTNCETNTAPSNRVVSLVPPPPARRIPNPGGHNIKRLLYGNRLRGL